MRILVTGASGYLGTGIVEQLLNNGFEVIATDVVGNKIDERAVIKLCDLFSVEEPYTYFGQPDILLHLAWRNGFVHNAETHIVDLPRHYEFIKKMVVAGVKHVAVMGTMHEVGFYEGSIDENTPTNPMSLYGISKDALRYLVKLLCNEESAVFQWFRGYYIVGNTEYGNSVFSKITAAEKAGKEFFPFSTGCIQYDFIDYPDFCKQVAMAVSQTEVTGIINICSGWPEKLRDRVNRFINEHGYKIKLDYGKFPDRPYDSRAVWGNDEKIKQIMQRVK